MFASRRRTYTAADRDRKYAAILAMCDEAPASREVTIAVYGKPAQTAWQRESVASDR